MSTDIKNTPQKIFIQNKHIDINKESVFVIHKHDASNLHYDFRIKIDKTLASWVIPKGPSTDPSQKRLALPTQNHPLSYTTFEGIIPEGQYGAGKVIVWDTGTYQNLKSYPIKQAKEKGQIEIWLHGEKIQGGYALVRTTNKHTDNERWLLIKMKDEHADARRNPTSTEPQSVLSGKKIENL